MAASAASPSRVGGGTTVAAQTVRSIPIPGDGLLHPLVLVAIAVLIANDHVLKTAWPGLLTGKLSDFAGLLFFPLFLQAAWEVGSWAAGRPCAPSRKVLLATSLMTGLLFASIKLIPAATVLAETALGAAQWAVGNLLGINSGTVVPVVIVADPTDLVALSMLAMSYVLGLQRCRRSIS